MKSALKFLGYCLLALLIIGGIASSFDEEPTPVKAAISNIENADKMSISAKPAVESKIPKSFIAKCAIAALMGRSPKIIKSELVGDVYYTTYVRPDDNSRWNNKVKFIGENQILWASEPGRWRDTVEDEKIYWSENGSKITITTVYSDNSKSENAFKYKK